MCELKITGITVSLDIKANDFGTGSSNFVSLKAETINREGDSVVDGVSLDDALALSLEMHFKAFESVIAARVGSSAMTGDEFKEALVRAQKRFNGARKHLGITTKETL